MSISLITIKKKLFHSFYSFAPTIHFYRAARLSFSKPHSKQAIGLPKVCSHWLVRSIKLNMGHVRNDSVNSTAFTLHLVCTVDLSLLPLFHIFKGTSFIHFIPGSAQMQACEGSKASPDDPSCLS